MKKLIALIVIGLALTIAGSAQAQSSYEILIPVRSVLTADIINVRNVAGELLPEVGVSGELVIDKRLKSVILNVRQQDFMDVTFSKAVYQTQLPLLSVVKDVACGTVTYTAGTDPRQLGRVVETLTIVDNTKNICEQFRRYSPTEVRLERSFNGVVLEMSTTDISLTPLKRETIE
jgi:hypothetical protein